MISSALKKALTVGSINCNDFVIQKYPQKPTIEHTKIMIQSLGNIVVMSEVRILAFGSIENDKSDKRSPHSPDHHNSTRDSISEHKLIETLITPSAKAAVIAKPTPM